MIIAETERQLNINSQKRIMDSKHSIDITFQNVYYSVKIKSQNKDQNIQKQSSIIQFVCPTKKQKVIINHLTGIAKTGKLTAIMGQSGSGKTTLLDIIACRLNQKYQANLQANCQSYTLKQFSSFGYYLLQDDIFINTLTVKQTLGFAYDLKNNNKDQRQQRLNNLINQLKLQKCQNTIIGNIGQGISGGQRKRLSLALAMISDPKVLVLDQPTSGLDSLTSYIVVKYLKKLVTQQQKTVLITIHQPNEEIFKLIDNLLILVQGSIVYQGQGRQMQVYFQQNFRMVCPQFMNPIDFIMSKLTQTMTTTLNNQLFTLLLNIYKQKQQPLIMSLIQQRNAASLQTHQQQVSWINKIKILLKREFINSWRNMYLLKAKIISSIFLAIFMGGIYFNTGTTNYTSTFSWQMITGFMYIILIVLLMQSMSPLSILFPSQRQIIFREEKSKFYTIFQYYASKCIHQIPQTIFIPLLITSIIYFMVGLNISAYNFFIFYFVMIMTYFFGASLGYLVGSMLKDQKLSPVLGPILLLHIRYFSGFMKNRLDLPVWLSWLQYTSPLKYAYILLMQDQVKGRQSNISSLNFDISLFNSALLLIGTNIFYRILPIVFLWRLKKVI